MRQEGGRQKALPEGQTCSVTISVAAVQRQEGEGAGKEQPMGNTVAWDLKVVLGEG